MRIVSPLSRTVSVRSFSISATASSSSSPARAVLGWKLTLMSLPLPTVTSMPPLAPLISTP